MLVETSDELGIEWASGGLNQLPYLRPALRWTYDAREGFNPYVYPGWLMVARAKLPSQIRAPRLRRIWYYHVAEDKQLDSTRGLRADPFRIEARDPFNYEPVARDFGVGRPGAVTEYLARLQLVTWQVWSREAGYSLGEFTPSMFPPIIGL